MTQKETPEESQDPEIFVEGQLLHVYFVSKSSNTLVDTYRMTGPCQTKYVWECKKLPQAFQNFTKGFGRNNTQL